MDGSSFFTVRLCCNDRYGGDVSACTCSFFNIDLESNVWLLSIRHYDCWLYSFYNTAWFCTAQCDVWWNRGDHRCAHVSVPNDQNDSKATRKKYPYLLCSRSIIRIFPDDYSWFFLRLEPYLWIKWKS